MVSKLQTESAQFAANSKRILRKGRIIFSTGAAMVRSAAKEPWDRRDGRMRFLFKTAFWLTIVVLLLPVETRQDEGARVSPIEALGAAQAAVEDASAFCSRKPDACEVGAQAFQTFGEKALQGTKLLYEFLAAHFTGEPRGPASTATGSIRREPKPGEHTLRPEDLVPAWNGPGTRPVPLPPRRPA